MGKQIDEPLQIGLLYYSNGLPRIVRCPSGVADHVQIRFGLHDVPQGWISGQPRATSLNLVTGHSRKHSRHYGSARPRAADRFASASGFSRVQNLPESTCTPGGNPTYRISIRGGGNDSRSSGVSECHSFTDGSVTSAIPAYFREDRRNKSNG